MDLLTPRFAVEAHLANVFAEEAVALTEQQMAQEQATASEPGEQAEGEVPMQLPDNSPLLLMTRCAGTPSADSFMIQPIMRAPRG